MKAHPAAELFPLLSGTAFDTFKADIAENGVLEPIQILDGQILDGRNRFRACQDLGIEPPTIEFEGHDPVAFVVSMNLHRRQLTASQRAMVAVEIERVESRLAQERMLKGNPKDPTEKIPEGDKGEAREKAAEAVGVNPRYVSDAKRIENEAPDLADRVRKGDMTMPRATSTLNARKRNSRSSANRKPNTSNRTGKRQSHADKTGETEDQRTHRLELSRACYTLANASMTFEQLLKNTPPNHRAKLNEAANAAKRWIK